MATFTVNTISDDNDAGVNPGADGLSMREAIRLANEAAGADTIEIDLLVSGGGVILTGGQLVVTETLTIDGDPTNIGNPQWTIDANNLSRAIESSADLTLIGLTIKNGSVAGDGGGINATGTATLTITESVITANKTTGDNADGGGIAVASGDLTINRSTVSGNSTSGIGSDGGGIFSSTGAISLIKSTVSGNSTTGSGADGGGIYINNNVLALTNTTISGNSTAGSGSQGGGIYNNGGDVTLFNSTVTGNFTSGDASPGGGIFLYDSTNFLTLINSIVLGNDTTFAGVGNEEIGGFAVLNQPAPNIIGGVDPATPADVFAALDGNGGGLLASNGGLVQTVALKGSLTNPALDAGDDGLDQPTDARGEARADVPGLANYGASYSDLGAFELLPDRSLVVTTLDDVVDPFDNKTSLREAIAFSNDPTTNGGTGDADNDTFDNDTVTFDPSLAGGTILLVGGQLEADANAEITIDGDIDNDHSPDITIDAQTNSRILKALADTTLIGLTLINGKAPNANFERGGAVLGGHNLTIEDSVFSGNSTTGQNGDGGAIYAHTDITIHNSTFTNNMTEGATSDGGAIYAGGTIVITDSTITDNSTAGDNSDGGGIYASTGSVALTDSTVSGNSTASANSSGGGVYGYTGVSLTRTTVSGNSTASDSSPGGGVYIHHGTSTFTDSTVSGNSTVGTGSNGGGVYIRDGSLTLSNTTIANNNTSGSDSEGGGIASFKGDVILVNSTVTGNKTTGSGSDGGGIYGGGVFGDAATVSVTSSIVLGNNTTTNFGPSDVFMASGSPTETGPSIIHPLQGLPTDVFAAIDPLTGGGVLADNGGPVKTVALLGSTTNPALDKGGAGSTSADARGEATFDFASIANANGNARDLGAFELQLEEAVVSPAAEARSLVVTILGDVLDPFDGETSLREAIAFANDVADADGDTLANDTITFAAALAGGGTITLGGTQLEITSETTIDNGSTPDIIIDGNNASRVLNTTADTTLRGLTIKNGKTTDLFGSGAGIKAGAALTVVDSVIRDNQTTGNQSFGAGIFVGGTLTMTGSMVISNSTTGTLSLGGGIFATLDSTLSNSTIAFNSTAGSLALGGGIAGLGHLALSNVTVARNTTKEAAADGGGIFVNTVTLENSTVSGNSTAGSGAEGGGIYAVTSAEVANSLILGNVTSFTGVSGDDYFAPTLISVNSLGGSANPADIFYQTSDIIDGNGVNTGVKAGVLGDYGGTVNTIALLPDPANPVLDRGTANSTAADARGQATFDFASIANPNGNARDLGAYELDYEFASLAAGAEPRSLVVTILGDVLDPFDNQTSLREAIAFANDTFFNGGDADGVNGAVDTITFAPALAAGGTITLAYGQLEITSKITIDNVAAPDIVIDAGGLSRVILTSDDLSLKGLTITGGHTSFLEEFGGGVSATGAVTLTIADSVITGNSTAGTAGRGGGIYSPFALTLIRSEVTENSTTNDNSQGGGIYASGTLTVTDSLISDNSTGGTSSSRGGGIFSDGTATITSSTVSGNSTTANQSQGGGIYSLGTLTLTNSTVSGNSTNGNNSVGGGFFGVTVTLTNSTVTGNSTAGDATGGGFFSNSSVILNDSLVVGNVTKSAGTGGDETQGSITNNRSIVGGTITAADVFASTYTIAGTSVLAGVLADNGGPVPTVALLADVTNPAIDAGNDALDPPADARGQARVNVPGLANNGTNISDLGAFEVPNVAPFVANTIPDQSSLEELPWLFTVAANAFTDPEGVPLTYSASLASNAPLPAWLTFTPATRTFSGTPPLNFFGVIDLKVTASDGSLSISDVFRLTIVDVVDNAPPDAVDDTFTAPANTTTTFTSAQLLANDRDPESNPFRIIDVFQSVHGAAIGQSDGSVQFTPLPGFAGLATFRYTIGDIFGGQDSATVTVNVSGAGSGSGGGASPPAAPPANSVWTIENFVSRAVPIGASDPDGDIASYAIKSGAGPLKGSVSFAGGSFVYTPTANAEGADAFTIRITDAGGRFVDQVVSAFIAPMPVPSEWRLLADDGQVLTIGGTGDVFGTSAHQQVTIADVPGVVSFDGSFNAGGDVVKLAGNAANWQIVGTGSSVILGDGTTFARIPVGPTGMAVVFDDGARSLRIDTASGALKIGAQTISDRLAPVTAASQVLTLPTGADSQAVGRLLMAEGGEVVANGQFDLFGTAGNEQVTLLGGAFLLDGSFNGGGDTIVFPGNAAGFTAQVLGSSVAVEGTGLAARIPFGPATTTLDFANADHALHLDAGNVLIGSQIITASASPLTFA